MYIHKHRDERGFRINDFSILWVNPKNTILNEQNYPK